MALFNPGAYTVLQQMQDNPPTPQALGLPMDAPEHAAWQALVREGQVVEAIKEARELGLDLPQAYALINEYREQEDLMPAKRKRWWWPFD